MIAHLVLFNPKPGASESDLRSFAKIISEACQQIGAIQRSRVGTRVEIDAGYPRSFGEKTYQYVAIFEFADAAALKEYLKHPLHQRLGRLFWVVCESAMVIEAEIRDGRTIEDFKIAPLEIELPKKLTD